VSRPTFVVPVADLEQGPKRASWPLGLGWLRQIFEGTDAVPESAGELDVELTKNGRDVLVRGAARVHVQLPDARSLEPVSLLLEPEIFLMLSPASPPEAARRARRKRHAATDRRSEEGGRNWKDDPLLDGETAARDVYSGDLVVLDDFVREFLLLDLPMVVTRSDLPLDQNPAIRPPSEPSPKSPDPRLAPLAAIASRLRQNKE
jgi:DUF177 domain-containing protein